MEEHESNWAASYFSQPSDQFEQVVLVWGCGTHSGKHKHYEPESFKVSGGWFNSRKERRTLSACCIFVVPVGCDGVLMGVCAASSTSRGYGNGGYDTDREWSSTPFSTHGSPLNNRRKPSTRASSEMNTLRARGQTRHSFSCKFLSAIMTSNFTNPRNTPLRDLFYDPISRNNVRVERLHNNHHLGHDKVAGAATPLV